MDLFEVTLTASKVVRVLAANRIDAESKAATMVPTLDEIEVTDVEPLDMPYWFDTLPPGPREAVAKAWAGEDMPVLGVGQSANRLYDEDGWRVWQERHNGVVTVEMFNGDRWINFSS